MARRRRRRSAEFRNGLRLGAVLLALVGVNVYVFFIKPGTALREVLRPASSVRSAAPDRYRADAAGPAGGTRVVAIKPGETVVAPPPSEAGADGATRAVEGKFGPNDRLRDVMARAGFGAQADSMVAALSRLSDPKLIRPGENYTVRLDDEGVGDSFEYRPTPALMVRVFRAPDGGWKAAKEEKPLETRVIEAAGVIDSSLYESVQKAGESTALVSLLVDLLAWDVNFYIDTNAGDTWKVVVEKLTLGGQFYKYGRVLAAEYGGKVGTFRVFHWKANAQAPGPGKYYDDKGQAIAKTFLKTPLRFVRVSSKFDRKRFHPILHREKAHLGIDYAAPVGTPVWACAGGKVALATMKRGSGNTVVINHATGLSTRYYHLSRFARGLRAGQQVKQKDVIGYVGTTGLSTGPHLHFSVTKAGVFVDPSKLAPGREPPVAERMAFLEAVKPRLASLRAMQPSLVAARATP